MRKSGGGGIKGANLTSRVSHMAATIGGEGERRPRGRGRVFTQLSLFKHKGRGRVFTATVRFCHLLRFCHGPETGQTLRRRKRGDLGPYGSPSCRPRHTRRAGRALSPPRALVVSVRLKSLVYVCWQFWMWTTLCFHRYLRCSMCQPMRMIVFCYLQKLSLRSVSGNDKHMCISYNHLMTAM